MEKYAVQIDPEKVKEKEKTAGKTSSSSDSNIPLDPEKGSLPFEKEPPKAEGDK